MLGLLLLATAVSGFSYEGSDIGRLPSLGWNSWNHFQCDIDQDKVRAAGKHTVELGLKV